MEAAIGGLIFIICLGLIVAVCYKHRQTIRNWLENIEERPKDLRLEELKGKVKEAKSSLKKYERKLQLQASIKDAQAEIDDMDKAETGEK